MIYVCKLITEVTFTNHIYITCTLLTKLIIMQVCSNTDKQYDISFHDFHCIKFSFIDILDRDTIPYDYRGNFR